MRRCEGFRICLGVHPVWTQEWSVILDSVTSYSCVPCKNLRVLFCLLVISPIYLHLVYNWSNCCVECMLVLLPDIIRACGGYTFTSWNVLSTEYNHCRREMLSFPVLIAYLDSDWFNFTLINSCALLIYKYCTGWWYIYRFLSTLNTTTAGEKCCSFLSW